MQEIIAVIVTNNRLQLLQEAVECLLQQSVVLKKIVIVNNASTDGSGEWLDAQKGLLVIHQENLGGSGGFHTGIMAAIVAGTDWVWVMDDDTMCEVNTLKKLVEKIEKVTDSVGFIGSKCVWKDGSPHLMNIPEIKPKFNRIIPFNKYDKENLLLIENCSFVSLLINAKAVKSVGLPYKEFFIWGDDQEYTRRITAAGFLGMYCTDSVVLHKTPTNYSPDFYRDSRANIWKHRYGFRNEFFMVKKTKGFLYYVVWLIFKVAYTSFNIVRIRKADHFKFIGALIDAAWKSIFFNPRIDHIPPYFIHPVTAHLKTSI